MLILMSVKFHSFKSTWTKTQFQNSCEVLIGVSTIIFLFLSTFGAVEVVYLALGLKVNLQRDTLFSASRQVLNQVKVFDNVNRPFQK